jgi:hypothetical protein
MNMWDIPRSLEEKVRRRDKLCVYCHVVMKEYPHASGVPKKKSTWEHIDNNDLRSADNLVRCCGACNSSKGTKKLWDWFKSEYCKTRSINRRTVSPVVQNWLRHHVSR